MNRKFMHIEKTECLNTGGNVLVDCLFLKDGNYVCITDEVVTLDEGDGSLEKAYDNSGENNLGYIYLPPEFTSYNHYGGKPLWFVDTIVSKSNPHGGTDTIYMRSGPEIVIDRYTVAVLYDGKHLGSIARTSTLIAGNVIETKK